MEEHSATNVKEYERMSAHPRGKHVAFVYDVPDTDVEKAPKVWKKNGETGEWELDRKSKRLAEINGAFAKNARGDLPAVIVTPDSDPDYGGMEATQLAMTRSIGDFYHQTFGVSWKPEVISVDLADPGFASLEHLTLILCSDGVWDLWEYEQVFEAIVSPPERSVQSTDKAKAFFERCIVQGTEMFEDTADNMTGVVVYLNPKGITTAAPKPAATPKKTPNRNLMEV